MSERLAGSAGIAQDALASELKSMPDHIQPEGSGIIDRLRSRWAALATVGALAMGSLVGQAVEEAPAYAVDAPRAMVGMPFDGKWAYSGLTEAACGPESGKTSHPSCHETYVGDWATDLYAAAGTEVKLKVAGDQLSFSWDKSASGTCGETRRVNILVNNVKVGRVHFTHLNGAASTDSAPTNGMVLGKIANLSCNPGGPNAKHVHVEFGNEGTDTHSCYTNYSDAEHTAGMALVEGASLGVLGSPNTGAKEACATSAAPEAPPAPSSVLLNFVRLNHQSGKIEIVSYDESGNYQAIARHPFPNYPNVPIDGSVVPLFQPNGDLSFVNLTYYTGHVEIATYSKASSFQERVQYAETGYPAVPADGAVVPLIQHDGDLSFVRLNYASGHVEIVTYSKASNYRDLTEGTPIVTAYPAVETDGSVVPLFWLNDDLVFLRMNHASGRVELNSYSKNSRYQDRVNAQLLPYWAVAPPGVAPDGAVVPMFHPRNGNLEFVRLNYPGRVEVVAYNVGTGFQSLADYDLSSYPSVAPDGAVVPSLSN